MNIITHIAVFSCEIRIRMN